MRTLESEADDSFDSCDSSTGSNGRRKKQSLSLVLLQLGSCLAKPLASSSSSYLYPLRALFLTEASLVMFALQLSLSLSLSPTTTTTLPILKISPQ